MLDKPEWDVRGVQGAAGVAALVLQGLQHISGSEGLQLAPTWTSRFMISLVIVRL